MNLRILSRHLPAITCAASISFGLGTLLADDSAAPSPQSTPAAATPASPPAPAKLSWGVPDILKLAEAQIGEDAIVAYIQGSGRIYNLSVEEIVYLRSRGVSDRVITAMLEQRKRLADKMPQSPPAPPPTFMPPQTPPATPPPQPAPPPQPTYVASAPVYVAPPTYVYYSYPRYYVPFPAVSFGFRFGHFGFGFRP